MSIPLMQILVPVLVAVVEEFAEELHDNVWMNESKWVGQDCYDIAHRLRHLNLAEIEIRDCVHIMII
jgi:hypothetical protein